MGAITKNGGKILCSADVEKLDVRDGKVVAAQCRNGETFEGRTFISSLHPALTCDLVKTGLKDFYESTGMHYVSTHPMFGPTFANLGQLANENAIIINEGDFMGRCFFKELYARLGLHICEYTFDEHDRTVAYSLSIPFISTFAFAAVMKHQDAPGTTFKRHMQIAKGVLSEDDTLLREILFNPYTKDQVSKIRDEMKELIQIIEDKDEDHMQEYLTKIRGNIK